MIPYCTIDDVLNVATDYKTDVVQENSSTPPEAIFNVDTDTISRAEVYNIIIEASNMVRECLKPRYKIELIDDYEPDYPPVVVYLTKTLAAMYMYQRYGMADVKHQDEKIEQLEKFIERYYNIITNGALLDGFGVLVKTEVSPSIMQGRENDNYQAIQFLKAIYTFGRIY